MQNDAVAESVRILREHAGSDSGGSPRGEARGRIILPCGTGKTRISLQIVEELTPPGAVSVVLCPSIALVAQIRREYLQYAAARIDVLAVCSDQTAGYDPKKEGVRNPTQDPTVDNGSVSASEIKGSVTTDADEIAAWMLQPALGGDDAVKVLIGTYQSSVRVSDALLKAGVRASVLIADEAHRTAGLKRRNSASAKARGEEKRVRDFTVCHDGARFPATYRVYQTATPRIYEAGRRATRNPDWIVRSMDDESTFGVELYRKSYYEAVRNGWLSNYRIIALGVNDERAYAEANALARAAQSAGRRRMTTVDYMRGLAFALAMGGATQGGEDEDEDVDIRSCIAFMNTVDKSKNMARDLQTDAVKKWVDGWLKKNAAGRGRSDYSLEHLDASSSAAARETAKTRLADADSDKPHGVVNVGIFGEGTDSPSLSAVAFLEARKSPIDVVQAVGRAMRTAPGKDFGYIICPILFPPSADPETWLASESQEQGWQELGQILLALRAHDKDIEENLEDLLYFYMPKPPATERSILAVARAESKKVEYLEYEGPVGAAEEAVERMLKGASRQEVGANRIGEKPPSPYKADEPTQVIAGKKNDDGSSEIRIDAVERDKPKAGEANGKVDIEKTKTKARDKMLNRGVAGRVVKPGERSGKRRKKIKPGEDPKPRRTSRQVAEESAQRMLKLSGMGESGAAIKMNLLTKSGLSENRVVRDMNILEESVSEAARHLRDEDLLKTLNVHFGLDRLKTAGGGKKQADGCTVAALLMMNAAMLHQRIANGRWLPGVRDMSQIKNDKDAARTIIRQWNVIMRHDFRPRPRAGGGGDRGGRGNGQARRLGARAAPRRRRSGAHRRDLRRHGSRPRGAPLQPRDGKPGVRRRLLHAPGRRLPRRAPDARRRRRNRLDKPRRVARAQDGRPRLRQRNPARRHPSRHEAPRQRRGRERRRAGGAPENRRRGNRQGLGHQPRIAPARRLPADRRQQPHKLPPNGTPPNALRTRQIRPRQNIVGNAGAAWAKGDCLKAQSAGHTRRRHSVPSGMGPRRRTPGLRTRLTRRETRASS